MLDTQEIFRKAQFILEPDLREEVVAQGKVLSFEKGETIVREGQYVKVLPIVLTGQIRVFQSREDREILLYYVRPGETCMMSLSACFFNHESPSQAVASSKVEILAIPTNFITEWQRKYPSWNKFVIQTFRNRYDELLDAFESVAFSHVDKRVMNYLRTQQEEKGESMIPISHQQLANEIGTTRVVVSRILKQFEMNGRVKLHRAAIELL
ncbi:Crp/Fnr family transcriptional regulator [bacterium SCSIO 12741]|nr:Crp/Fnr family transcriptional regulator [bacterium SCSIO 12741]